MEIYNIVGLAKDLELECADITDLYTSYIDQINEHCQNLEENFNKNDFTGLINEVHNVKGVAGNLLINDVFEEASSFGRLLNQGNFTDLKENVDSISNLLINSGYKVRKSFAKVNITL